MDKDVVKLSNQHITPVMQVNQPFSYSKCTLFMVDCLHAGLKCCKTSTEQPDSCIFRLKLVHWKLQLRPGGSSCTPRPGCSEPTLLAQEACRLQYQRQVLEKHVHASPSFMHCMHCYHTFVYRCSTVCKDHIAKLGSA